MDASTPTSVAKVVTVGHAIVDVLAPSPDDLVESLGLVKGTMTLVEGERAAQIYDSLGPTTEVSGGSAANTAACLASLGEPVIFVGKVGDDALGGVFAHDIRAAGVTFDPAALAGGGGTGRCLILVTPDAEKTMCTSLGVGALLDPHEVAPAVLAGAEIVYIEGYLYGDRHTDATVESVIDQARAAGTKVALTLSDPAWVDMNGHLFDRILDRVDLLFANEEEARRMSGTATAEESAVLLGKRCETVAVTLGARGSLVYSAGETIHVPASPVERVVDTTGAGDSYAAGFLYGYVAGLGAERSARLGGLAASEVVSHLGARPVSSLERLARDRGLLP